MVDDSPQQTLRALSIYTSYRTFLASSGILFFLIGLTVRPAFGQMGPSKVAVAEARQVEVEPTLRVVGTIRPWRRSVVAADVAGIVNELPLEEGDVVTHGQLLCKLRDVTHRTAYDEAVARRDVLAAALEEQRALEAKAEFEQKRIAGLWELDRCTEKEFRDAEADHRAAVVRTLQAEHALRAQEAVVTRTADQLERTRIVAPFDGQVIAKRTEVGAWVDVGGEVAELLDLSTARVRVNVPEAIVDHCTVGDEVMVSVAAVGKDYAARISRVISSGDDRARSFPVEIDLPNEDGRLRDGMFVSAAVPSGKKEARLVIPKDAVVLRGAQMIFVVHDGESGATAVPMTVQIISEYADRVAVEAAGLSAGDRVVIRGNEYMFGPSPVIIVPSEGEGEKGKDEDVKTSRR